MTDDLEDLKCQCCTLEQQDCDCNIDFADDCGDERDVYDYCWTHNKYIKIGEYDS